MKIATFGIAHTMIAQPQMAGEMAAAMAAAPRNARTQREQNAPKVEQTATDSTPTPTESAEIPAITESAPATRSALASVLGRVQFKPSDNVKVFTNDRTGVKSRKIANVLVELGNTGVFVRGSIYARQGAKDTKARAEFSWFGANMQTCLTPEDAQSKADMQSLQNNIAVGYAKWLKDNPQQQAAAASQQEVVELDGLSL